MVFTLPSNASQALYPENAMMDLRVALLEHVVLLCSNDYKVTLAGFTYAHTWYNMPELVGQTHHTAAFNFLVGHIYPTPCSDNHRERAPAETEGAAETPSSHACESLMFIKSRRTLSPGYYEHVRQILHDLNGHGSSSWMALQFSYHALRNHVLVAFRPSLKDCTGRMTLSRALSLLLGWPDQETVVMGRGKPRHIAPSQHRRDLVERLRALQPCRQRSSGGQCQELPVAQCVPKVATVRSYVTSLSNWIGCPGAGQSSSTSTWL